MQPSVAFVARSVCLSVCLSVCVSVFLLGMSVSCAKTDEPIEMPFGMWTRGDQDTKIPRIRPPREWALWGVVSRLAVDILNLFARGQRSSDTASGYQSTVLVAGRSSVPAAGDGSSAGERCAGLRHTEPLLSARLPRPLPAWLRTATPRRAAQVRLSVGRNVDHRRTVARLLLYVLYTHSTVGSRRTHWTLLLNLFATQSPPPEKCAEKNGKLAQGIITKCAVIRENCAKIVLNISMRLP